MPDLTHKKVGDTVWVQGRHHGFETTVTKVGRLYLATPDQDRIDRATGATDYYEKAWPDKGAYEASEIAHEAWRHLYRQLSFSRPAHMTIEDIRKVGELVGIRVP